MRQESLAWLGAGIELVNGIVNRDETKYAQLINVKANARKGRLIRKYNRWLRRSKILQWQYDQLCAELFKIDPQIVKSKRMRYE